MTSSDYQPDLFLFGTQMMPATTAIPESSRRVEWVDESNPCTAVDSKDDILTFLPGIGSDEYEIRAMLRTMRNCAGAMISKTDSDTARALAWICAEYATEYIYSGARIDKLSEIGRFCNRVMVTAMQAELIDDGGAA